MLAREPEEGDLGAMCRLDDGASVVDSVQEISQATEGPAESGWERKE
jgi:hypothetical protein